MEFTQPEIHELAKRLIGWFDSPGRYVIALSGGVDSAVVAAAGSRSTANIVAATGIGPATSQQERNDAEQLSKLLCIDHHWIEPAEHLSDDYRRNDLQRCFHCKKHLFEALGRHFPDRTVLTGTNLDDLGDYRPGLEAARIAQVRSPLAELKIEKAQVRQLAQLWNLPLADKPASPCLASRIAYGVEVTRERLARVEAAELYLKRLLDLNDCRVRVHQDELARIEVPLEKISLLTAPTMLSKVGDQFRVLGFRHVTLDLAGLRSGSLNPSSEAIAAQQMFQISTPSSSSTTEPH